MQVTARGFRKWLKRLMSSRQRGDMNVLTHIRDQYGLSLGSYDRPRMTMELKEVGLDVGERRAGRLMKINGIKPVRTHKHKVTTNSNDSLGIVANVLDGNFTADAPNRKWVGNISYIWTAQGWLYLAVILDLHSRRVVGWAVSDKMKKIWRSRHSIWPYAYAIRRKGASSIPIAAANTALMMTKRSCRPTACGHQ
jgi:putative transposase